MAATSVHARGGDHRAARRGLRLLHGQHRQLRQPADAVLPVPRHRADPADRAADDADHHHRRDRPVGRQRGRPVQRPGRDPAPGRRPLHPSGSPARHPHRWRGRRVQRLPRGVRRAAVPGRHDRHPGPLPRHRGRAARDDRGHRLPREVDRPRQGPDRLRPVELPGGPHPVRRAPRPVRAAPALLAVRPRDLRDRAQRRGGALHRRQRRPHQAPPLRAGGRGLGPRRGLLHAPLRQCPRRQRDRPRAAGHRRGAAGRGLDLRRPRCPARGRRRRPAHRRHLQRHAPGRPDGQRHQHRHRSASRALGDVHQPPRLGLLPAIGEDRGSRPLRSSPTRSTPAPTRSPQQHPSTTERQQP